LFRIAVEFGPGPCLGSGDRLVTGCSPWRFGLEQGLSLRNLWWTNW